MNYTEQILPFNENLKYRFNEKYALLEDWIGKGIKYVRVVLQDDKSEIIHFSGTTNNLSNILNPTFQDIYDMIGSIDENKFSILKTLYNRVSPDLILSIIDTPCNAKNKYLSTLLQESNGYMLYAHQFEDFLKKYLELSNDEAVEFRKLWNKKSIKNREILIQSNFYYLIESRMPQYFVFHKVS